MTQTLTTKQIIEFLYTIGYKQYYGFDDIVIKDDHSISVHDDQIFFEDDVTGFQDYEDITYFETTSDISSWIDGSLQFLEEDELEDAD